MSGLQTAGQHEARGVLNMGARFAKRLFPLGAAMTMLASCSSFEPDYVACPSVKALAGAENVISAGADTGNRVTVRFDGVNPQCVATPSGYDMTLNFALVLKRDESLIGNAERVPVDITLAYLDKDDQIISRSVKQVTGYISDFTSATRPVFSIEDEIPTGARVVIGIGKKVE